VGCIRAPGLPRRRLSSRRIWTKASAAATGPVNEKGGVNTHFFESQSKCSVNERFCEWAPNRNQSVSSRSRSCEWKGGVNDLRSRAKSCKKDQQVTHTHTHTHRQRTTPPTPTHTHTRQEHHPKPPRQVLWMKGRCECARCESGGVRAFLRIATAAAKGPVNERVVWTISEAAASPVPTWGIRGAKKKIWYYIPI